VLVKECEQTSNNVTGNRKSVLARFPRTNINKKVTKMLINDLNCSENNGINEYEQKK
jgi:hypothetical protein